MGLGGGLRWGAVVAVVAIVAVVAVGRISKDGLVSSSGGGGPFPPEVHHLRNAMSSSVLERGSLDEIRAKRVLMGSLIITMTCASRMLLCEVPSRVC